MHFDKFPTRKNVWPLSLAGTEVSLHTSLRYNPRELAKALQSLYKTLELRKALLQYMIRLQLQLLTTNFKQGLCFISTHIHAVSQLLLRG
jgi:hypothetical protein